MTKEEYIQNPNICIFCSQPILPRTGRSLSRTLKLQYCSQDCFRSATRTREIYCLNCGKRISKSAKYYCDVPCQHEYKYKQYISAWKLGEENGLTPNEKETSKYVRRYMFEKYDSKCARCGWSKVNPTSGKIPLQIEHIDGNYKNNKEDNLILLCPNCHSLTPTFGNLNRGNGRDWRYSSE